MQKYVLSFVVLLGLIASNCASVDAQVDDFEAHAAKLLATNEAALVELKAVHSQEMAELKARIANLEKRVESLEQPVARRAQVLTPYKKNDPVPAPVPMPVYVPPPTPDYGSAISGLDTRLKAVEASMPRLACIHSTSNSNDLIFSGCNVHVQNGMGTGTMSSNGKGNLIVGYNENNDCAGACNRGGSHNVVVGANHEYASFGSILGGYKNSVTSIFASVLGGIRNVASGPYSSVSGGQGNFAQGRSAAVSGGESNKAMGTSSSVSGGIWNYATADRSSVSGGYQNKATGLYASISGGMNNNASNMYTSILGGQNQMTTADYQTKT